jgi:protein subunit release factor A
VTEKMGRVHTSAVSVAILPQADEVINKFCYGTLPCDMELDCFFFFFLILLSKIPIK